MSAAGVLREARDLICEFGWTQRRSGDRICGFCVMGAINEASDRIDWNEGRVGALRTLRQALDLSETTSLADWNDAACRTIDEVFSALNRAISIATSGERGAP